jgi:hypothetical protein
MTNSSVVLNRLLEDAGFQPPTGQVPSHPYGEVDLDRSDQFRADEQFSAPEPLRTAAPLYGPTGPQSSPVSAVSAVSGRLQPGDRPCRSPSYTGMLAAPTMALAEQYRTSSRTLPPPRPHGFGHVGTRGARRWRNAALDSGGCGRVRLGLWLPR